MHEFKEYPKWIPTDADGVVVWSKEEEAILRQEKPAAEEKKKPGRPKKAAE